jgi:hypothetical protein
MPTQKRLRRHDQPVSAPLRERAGERREEGTIGRPQRGALFLPSEHGELISQHEQLDVFGDLAAPASGKQPQHSREGEIGEGEQHPLILPEPTAGNAGTSNLSFETPQACKLRVLRPTSPGIERRDRLGGLIHEYSLTA